VAGTRACRAVVSAVRTLRTDVIEADLRMQDPPALPFRAGEWISVPFGPRTVRAYSIASTPRANAVLTLCADVAPGGPGSRWFRALVPGTVVTFKGPLGGFVVDRTDPRRPLFVAEEIGIVPVRSMLLDLHETGFDGRATLVYWARDRDWLIYDDDFRALAQRAPAFSYCPSVEGTVGDAVTRLAPDVSGLVAYVAGGAGTIAAAREALMARGLDRKAVKWERFYG
jgi:ferredoxin-NADP reductase